MTDRLIAAVAALETEFPGYFVDDISRAMGWGSHDAEGNYKPNAGAFRSLFGMSSWIVSVVQEGWEYESEHFIESHPDPVGAVEALRDRLRERRDMPHNAHIEDKVLEADCIMCWTDADALSIARADLPVDLEA